MNPPLLEPVAVTAALDDWRVLLGCVATTFSAPSYPAATAFAHEVALLAEDAQHHPDIDIRYPGRVTVVLTTHASGGLTQLDVDLARQIDQLAVESGLAVAPNLVQATEIAIDALDANAIRPFWKAVLGYVDQRTEAAYAEPPGLVDPQRSGPAVWFQTMDSPRPQRSRIHVDVIVPVDVAAARLEAAIAAGGVLLTDAFAPSFWVLADVEGNEACICTSAGRSLELASDASSDTDSDAPSGG